MTLRARPNAGGRRFLGFDVGDHDPAEAFAAFLLRPVQSWRRRKRGLR